MLPGPVETRGLRRLPADGDLHGQDVAGAVVDRCRRDPAAYTSNAASWQRSRGGKPQSPAAAKTSSIAGPFGLTPDVSRRVR